MQIVISSALPFPNIGWWMQTLNKTVVFDLHEHFEKMSLRNRYLLAGANGLLKLSVPLQGGRDQRSAMKDIMISDHNNWQVQHWRSICSAYRHAPYFDHFEASLHDLFQKPFEKLVDFNLASIHWIKEYAGLNFSEQFAEIYLADYEGHTDLRKKTAMNDQPFPKYFQLFEERNGFLPNLSILDLLFLEGPAAVRLLHS